MKKNMSNTDKLIRLVIALALALLCYFNFIEGVFAKIVLGIGIILLLTSLVSICPIYKVFGINTCKVNQP